MSTQGEKIDARKGLPSASGIHRLINCPASWLREKGLPDVTSEAAEKGTRIHKWLEDEAAIVLDDDEMETALSCRELEEQVVLEWGFSPLQCEREKRLWLNDFPFEVMSGAADAVYNDGEGNYLVIDYKTGRGAVPRADENYQLAALAVLVADNVNDLETIHCAIVQPLVSSSPVLVRYDKKDVEDAAEYFIGVIDAAQKVGGIAVPSESNCRYCKAFLTCKNVANTTSLAARSDITTEGWADYSDAKKLECYELAKLAEKWADMVNGYVRADLLEGTPINGLTLKRGACKRTITDGDACFELLPMLSSKEFISCCSVKMSSLESVFAKAEQLKDKEAGIKPRTQKALKEELSELISDVIVIKQNSPSVVKSEDGVKNISQDDAIDVN